MDATHDLPDDASTARLGASIAVALRPGGTVLLDGSLGAGKSTLCRALLRTLTGDPALDVPSPTYTLVQAYATPRAIVHHFDLWRLTGPEALDEIGFFDAAADIRLVEWGERLAAWGIRPEGAWTVSLEFWGQGRRARVRTP